MVTKKMYRKMKSVSHSLNRKDDEKPVLTKEEIEERKQRRLF
jgi:hypothetical protein